MRPKSLTANKILVFILLFTPLHIYLDNHNVNATEKAASKIEVSILYNSDYRPLFYRDTDGVSKGVMVDYWKLWSEKTGITVRIEDMPWQECLERAKTEPNVIIPAISYTQERDAFLDFSQSYIDTKQSLFLRKSKKDTILSDSKEFFVGVGRNTRVTDFLAENRPSLKIKTYDAIEDIMRAASRGEIDAFAMDKLCAEYNLNAHDLSDDFSFHEILYVGKACAAVKEGNLDILHHVNNGIEKINQDEVADIFEKYLNRSGLVPKQTVDILFFIMGAAIVAIFLFYLFFLKKRVRQRTDQLAKKNRELEKSESKYRSVFENTGTCTVIVEEDMTISMANSEIEVLTGVRAEDIEGRLSWTKFIHEEDREKVIQYHKARRTDGFQPPTNYETRIRDKYGDIKNVLMKVAMIPGTRQSVASIQDITFLKNAEKERYRLQKRLQHAQKMEAIGTLAGGVAHDLNNILSAIVTYPDLLINKLEEDSPFIKPLATIQKAGIKAATMVEDLLTLARRGVPIKEPVSLNKIIQDYLKSPEFIRVTSYHQNLNIVTDLDPDLPGISGSPLHLSKSIMNLISNAAEAMPNGGKVFISTESRRIDDDPNMPKGDYVVFTITDTGIGISSEDRERIFEPFYTKKIMGRSGTGLGMAIVWGVIKDHNGYIDVQSSKKIGTTFTLSFPVTNEKTKEEETPPPLAEAYMGKGESVLVVDDVEEQREIASAILTDLGYSVKAVSSGEDAIQYLKDNSADLILLDMIMDPGMDGYETYKEIVKIHPGQKAVIASGFTEDDLVKKAQELGAGEYIRKPYIMEKIGLVIRTELDK